MAAPVLICLSMCVSSSASAMTWMFARQEPSFSSMKEKSLASRFVLTQPDIARSATGPAEFNRALTVAWRGMDQRFLIRVMPSPTGSMHMSTLSSSWTILLKARIALVSAVWLSGSATSPPHNTLSMTIIPPLRSRR